MMRTGEKGFEKITRMHTKTHYYYQWYEFSNYTHKHIYMATARSIVHRTVRYNNNLWLLLYSYYYYCRCFVLTVDPFAPFAVTYSPVCGSSHRQQRHKESFSAYIHTSYMPAINSRKMCYSDANQNPWYAIIRIE